MGRLHTTIVVLYSLRCAAGMWGLWRRVCKWELRCAAASSKRPATAREGDRVEADAEEGMDPGAASPPVPPPAGAANDSLGPAGGGAGSGHGATGLVLRPEEAGVSVVIRPKGKDRGAAGHKRATVACGCLSVGHGHLLYSPWDRACVGVVQTTPHTTEALPCVLLGDATREAHAVVHPTFEQCVPDVPTLVAEEAKTVVSTIKCSPASPPGLGMLRLCHGALCLPLSVLVLMLCLCQSALCLHLFVLFLFSCLHPGS